MVYSLQCTQHIGHNQIPIPAIENNLYSNTEKNIGYRVGQWVGEAANDRASENNYPSL